MTSILRDSLGGNCKTVMIATIGMEKQSEDETLSTVRFATRCSKLVNDININEVTDLNTVVKNLQKQNIELSKRLAKQESIIREQDTIIKSKAGGSPKSGYSNYRQGQIDSSA